MSQSLDSLFLHRAENPEMPLLRLGLGLAGGDVKGSKRVVGSGKRCRMTALTDAHPDYA